MTSAAEKPLFRLLVAGHLVREGPRVVDASSTVSMVQAGARVLVVDTGSPGRCAAVKQALRRARVDPRSVEYVVNTHLHIDHCGCNDLFESARYVAHPEERPPIGTMLVSDEHELLPGITLLPTPGHTLGSISVLVRSDRKYAICGDAIPTRENYEKCVPPFISADPRLARRSMEAILAWADVVVPGHGEPFEVVGK